jgi:hypothetical protein
MMKWILLITLLICTITLERVYSNPPSFSCPGRFLGPPCQDFGHANVVFIATATEVTTVPFPSSPHPDWQEYWKLTAKLSVEETFRGEVGSEITYEGADCYYPFKQGEKYLIYAHKTADGKLSLNRDTTRTRLLSEAREDLEYIRNLSRMPDEGRIYGKAINFVKNVTLQGVSAPPTYGVVLPGVKIVAEGMGHRYETVTDRTGSYEFKGLTEGSYKIRAFLPSHFSGIEENVRVQNKGCSPVQLGIQATGIIEGKVLDDNGQPISNLTVSIFSNEGVTNEILETIKPHYEPRATTDKQGRFSFHRLPAGRYLLAVNLLKFYDRTNNGYPRTFYPGVLNLSDAGTIILGDGGQKQNIEFKLPLVQVPK